MIGGNNPFGQVWRTGANSATRISFSTAIMVGGSRLLAGTYELFSVPGKDEWTLIFQKAGNQWGAYAYDAKNDVLRVAAKPVALAEPVETFTIDINDISSDSATLDLVWEKTCVPVTLGVDVVGLLVAKIDAAMAAPGKKPYAQAAMFYLDHNLDLDKASAWIDAAIAEQPDAYYYIYQKARILAKKGDKEAALATAKLSIEIASKAGGPAKDEYIRLNEALIAGLK
jgi:tetratricopeptide (TPR) repeat protein